MEVKRRKLKKVERQAVYLKTGGYCAYCGCELRIEEMQIDHVRPLSRYINPGTDALENMLPSCRSCNHYKSSNTLEGFRAMLERQPQVLARDSVTYQIAVRYGLVVPFPHKVIFYFERMAPDLQENFITAAEDSQHGTVD